jgi:arylsulfatase A-like enzyme
MVDALQRAYARKMKTFQFLLDRGVEFAAHRSTNLWTLPALGTFHTGRMAQDHGVITWREPHAIPQIAAEKTLAECLKEIGFGTTAFATTGWGRGIFGFGRGFDNYVEGYWTADKCPIISAQLGILNGPQFVFIHMLDIHDWWEGSNYKMKDWDEMIAKERIGDEQIQHARECYAQAVKNLDDALLPFVVDNFSPDANTIVVLMTDHGEALFEYGPNIMGHGERLMKTVAELTDVPLVMAGGWTLDEEYKRKLMLYRTWDFDLMPTLVKIGAEMMDRPDYLLPIGIEGEDIRYGVFRGTMGHIDRPESIPVDQIELEKTRQQLKALGYVG